MTGPGDFDRAAGLDRLADGTFDVLVVGGGITGVGVALDAASRGLRTALVERDDLASGTSSKSSKLIHGGLRYLQQREIRLVYQALRERQILRRTAPHLVHVLPFLIPIFTRDGLISRRLARAMGSAMWMYDFTGGLRIGKLHKRLTTDQAMEHMPTLRRDRLAGGYLYYDAQADDARLVLTVARTAALDHGATIVNRAALRCHRRGRRPHHRGRGLRHRQCHRRLVRRRTGPRRRDPSRQHPAGQGGAHHRPLGPRAQRHRCRHPGAQGQAFGLRGGLG